jgi:hypothetical protein
VKMISALLLLAGLGLTGIGAWIAAGSVIITEKQADRLSATKWNGNQDLKASLLSQSRSAKNGLGLIVGGTALHDAGTLLGF